MGQGDHNLPMVDRIKMRKYPRDITSAIARLHQNLRHPTNPALVRTLKLAGMHAFAIVCACDRDCATCPAHKQQRCHRAARLPAAMYFNEVVSMDCLETDKALTGEKTTKQWMLNICGRATNVQKVTPIKTQSQAECSEAFEQHWVESWLGCPQALAFDGHESAKGMPIENLESYACKTYKTSSNSQW